MLQKYALPLTLAIGAVASLFSVGKFAERGDRSDAVIAGIALLAFGLNLGMTIAQERRK